MPDLRMRHRAARRHPRRTARARRIASGAIPIPRLPHPARLSPVYPASTPTAPRPATIPAAFTQAAPAPRLHRNPARPPARRVFAATASARITRSKIFFTITTPTSAASSITAPPLTSSYRRTPRTSSLSLSSMRPRASSLRTAPRACPIRLIRRPLRTKTAMS